MTLIVPYQSITIISYARVVLPASVCLDGEHQSQMGMEGGRKVKPHQQPSPCVCALSFNMCVQASSILLLSISDPNPPPPLFFCLFFPPHVFLSLDDSTSQSLPSETSPLLSNGKSISQFVKVALVLSRSSFSLTHSHSHTHTGKHSHVYSPSYPTNTATNTKTNH